MARICRQLRKRGFCPSPSCNSAHPTVCPICDKIKFISDGQHYLSTAHLEGVFRKETSSQSLCQPCGVVVGGSKNTFVAHYKSAPHLQACTIQGFNPSPPLLATTLVHCRTCCSLIRYDTWTDHFSGVDHSNRLLRLGTPQPSRSRQDGVKVTPERMAFGTFRVTDWPRVIRNFTVSAKKQSVNIERLELASEKSQIRSP